MSEPLVIHGFETSNNMKVRVALGYKRIAYTFETIDPRDRESIVRLSGQYLTPVLEHGPVVLFDSAAIIRYLETRFPHTLKLFGSSRDEQWLIEDWELFARATLAAPMMEIVHHRVAGEPIDAALQERCNTSFAAAVERLTARLDGRQWLVGDRMSVADVTAAPILHRIANAQILEWPDTGDALRPWIERVMAYDAGPGS